jgi:hypothetical protein
MAAVEFLTSIFRVDNQHFVLVPALIAQKCGSGRYIPVIVEIGKVKFVSTLLPAQNGNYRLILPRVVIRSQNIQENAELPIGLRPDLKRQVIEIPSDLMQELVKLPNGLETFQSQSPAMQRQLSQYISNAKSEATRSIRIRATIDDVIVPLLPKKNTQK